MPTPASQVADLAPELKAVLGDSPVYTTAEVQAEFKIESFAAPFVVATRKSDGQTGSLQFSSNPRYYFAFVEDAP